MDFLSTPTDKLIAYQWALANALEVIRQHEMTLVGGDLSQTKETLTDLADQINQALKDEQFEIDRLKEL